MKYLVIIFIYLLSAFSFIVLNLYDNGWQFLQPFLVTSLLVYYNQKNPWIYYAYAGLAGLFVDSFTGVFGLHAIFFMLIIFILASLQLTILTSKNILTIILLSLSAFVMFWLFFLTANFIFPWNLYIINFDMMLQVIKMMGINLFILILVHLLYYNFWAKHHDKKQSF
ncbi:hypothetical protein KKH39_03610 [Patescibacteria group bacterium]|nr:hypothetical protein [Patescibacteria group bacterium]